MELPEDNEELLQDYIDSVLTGEGAAGTSGTYGLSGRSLVIYEVLRDRIEDVAAGNTFSSKFSLTADDMQVTGVAYTAADLGIPALFDENRNITVEALLAFLDKLGIDVPHIVSALSADAPYDLYWFDKTRSVQIMDIGVYVGYDSGREDYIIWFNTGMTFAFPVEDEYALRSGDEIVEYRINPDVTGSIANALTDIQSVVSSFAGAFDYEKGNVGLIRADL